MDEIDELNLIVAEIDGRNVLDWDVTLNIKNLGVLIFYGNGAELGDFGQFAESLKKEKLKTYPKENIIIVSMQNKNLFFDYLSKFNKFQIEELHVFSHAAGGGLYLGYHNQESATSRTIAYNQSVRRGTKITYEEVIEAEVGALFTDDYLTKKALKVKSNKTLFSPTATIKFWGCNSGVSNWIYSDTPPTYYWSALNEKNTPKPSIAQATADFFQRETFGATSGSHIEFLVNGKWQIMKKQPKSHQGIRLHPDKGNYNSYKP